MEQRTGVGKTQAEPSRKEKPAAAARRADAPELPLQELQHAAGNRAVGRLLRSSLGGREGGGGDEQPSGPPALRRLGRPAPEGGLPSEGDDPSRTARAGLVQMKASPGAPSGGARADDSQAARRALSRGPGQPLDTTTRDFFERSFGYDFSPVRVHHDSQAAESADALGALAYTYGHQIVFRNGQYAPGTREGRRLLGHELAHVVQQSGGEGFVQGAGLTRDAYETEADAASARALAGLSVGPLARVGSALVQKADPPGAAAAPAPAPANVKPPQPGVETPPPGKPYLKGKYSGNYLYVYNSEEALTSPDIWEVIVFNHLTRVFPGISRGLTRWTLEEMRKVNNTITGDWHKTANEYSAVGFRVMADFHAELLKLVRSKQPDVVPVEPEPGADGAAGGGGGGEPPAEPEGGEVEAPPAAPPETVQGTQIHLPADLSPEERERLLKLIQEFLLASDPSKAGGGPKDLYITKRLRALLEEIDKSPLRAEILAIIRRGEAKTPDRHVEDALETAIADAKLEQASKDFNLPAGTGRKNVPERKRPVRGGINNLSRELVPGKQAKFMAEFTDEVDAFRVPVATIQWVAHKAGDRSQVVHRDVTSYISLPPKGSIDHRVFNVTFTEKGIYQIVALVHHNFYEPNVFELTVEVLTEKELTERQNKEALAGFTESALPSSSRFFYVGGVTGFQQGTITRGDLDPKAKILTIEERLKTSEDQEAELNQLIASYEGIDTSEARAIVSWAANYLATIVESRETLEEAKKLKATPLGVRGVFSSRTPEAPSKALNLLCYFTKDGDEYTVYLHDFTQLAESTDYVFSATGRSVEAAQEKVFIDQAVAYPTGTLSVTFQGYNTLERLPATWYSKFDMNTETFGKKVKAVVFDPYVDIAVNLATAVLMVVPGFQGAAVAIAIVYNTARTVSEMEEMANKGTLSIRNASIKGGEIALNLIPLAGKGFKVMTIAGRSFYAVESVTFLGNALLVSTQAMGEIERLRNGIIKDIAKLDGQIKTIERTNAADPRLHQMREDLKKLVADGQSQTVSVITSIAAEQGLQMIGQHLISGYMARKFSVGQLKSQGAFQHDPSVKTPYYDFEKRVIVGDELRITPGELERLQFQHGQSAALAPHVPDPVARKQLVEALGDRPVEVRKGERTGLKQEGDRAVLEVAEGATPGDILAAAQGAKAPAAPATPATPAPGAAAPAAPDTGAAAPAAKPPAQEKPTAPPPAQEQPAPAPPAAPAADLDKPAAGPAQQAKEAADNAKAATPAETPAAPQEGAAPPPAPDTAAPAPPAPDRPDVTSAKDAPLPAEKPPEARPAAEDDFKPVELKEPDKPVLDTPEAAPAVGKPADAPQPVEVKGGTKSGETPGAKVADTPAADAEGAAKAKPAEPPAPDTPEAKAKADAEAKAKADAAEAEAKKAAEAEAEAAAVAEKELEDKARARFEEAKAAGYQSKMKGSKQDTVDDFIALYKAGQELGPPPKHRWRSVEPKRVRKPPIIVTKDTPSADILEHLKGPKSKSTFKKFYETITGKKFATPEEVAEALEQVRKELDIANKPSNMDDVRHALKGKFKGRMLDSMFEGPGGKKLTPAESHARMRELTERLDSADKGPMTEEWQQRTRLAAGAQNTAEQVQVSQSDHPDVKLDKDRQLDRLEGIPTKTVKDGVETSELKNDVQINEVKSGEGALGDYDYGELVDHLKLAKGDGVTIDVRGTKRTVKEVRWTFTSPEGGKANADFLQDMLKTNGDIFSVEVYNSAGKRGEFTGADIAKNEWALHDFLGLPRPKTATPPASPATPPTTPTTPPTTPTPKP